MGAMVNYTKSIKYYPPRLHVGLDHQCQCLTAGGSTGRLEKIALEDIID